MPLPITYKLTCPKCGYTMIKTVGDADVIEVLYVECPKCGKIMKKEYIERKKSELNIFASIFNKFFNKY